MDPVDPPPGRGSDWQRVARIASSILLQFAAEARRR
jgi:hypothetical protein